MSFTEVGSRCSCRPSGNGVCLCRVVDILETFRHPSAELIEAVKQQIEMFDPDDPYWRVSDYSTFVTGNGSKSMRMGAQQAPYFVK